ncbi:unnamed protein product [Urochloa humidicola]
MAPPASPLPPPPGASTPTSPTPASTPDPAATTIDATPGQSSPFLSTPAPGTPPSSSAGGRPKTQRWCNDSPPTGKSGGGAPSYVEVLRLGMRLESAALKTPVITASAAAASPRAAPRIVLASDGRGQRKGTLNMEQDEEGWSPVLGRRRRRECGHQGPRRLVPTDLRGKCFNCFSPEHRAASCKLKTRCFRCRGLGHRSAECLRLPSRFHSEAPRPQHLVWRPKIAMAGVEPAAAVSQDDMPRGFTWPQEKETTGA